MCDDDDDDDKLNAQSCRADRRRRGRAEGREMPLAAGRRPALRETPGQGKGALQREGKDSCASYTPRDAHTHAPTHASANICTHGALSGSREHTP